jgi:hypothetical protein
MMREFIIIFMNGNSFGEIELRFIEIGKRLITESYFIKKFSFKKRVFSSGKSL